MKYQYVADDVKFYSYATCVKGVQGKLNGTTIHQYLRNVSEKKSSPEKFPFFKLLKNRTLTVSELQNWYWHQKKRNFVIYNAVESLFQFSKSKKNASSGLSVF